MFFSYIVLRLSHEHKIDCANEAEEGGEVIPVEAFVLEHEMCQNGEDYEGDTLLDYFQLHQGKRSSVSHKADSVCRHLTTIFEERYEPRERNNANEWPIR